MNPKSLGAFMAASLLLLATPAVRAQSAYSNAVMNLNPAAYWPLQETTQPPAANVETNLGSFGQIANIYYASTNAVQGFTPGAITGDSDPAVNFLGNASSFAIVPTTDNRVSLPAVQPFTVECWTRPTGSQSYVAMVNQTGPNNAGGLNGSTNSSGWSLCQNFAPYRGTGSANNPACWAFHVFNGVGFTGGAEAEIATNVPLNQWTHLVGVFDGTNCWLYANGNSNGMSFQIPITTGPSPASGYGSPIPGAAFSPDTWDPIEFGCTRGLGLNPFHGCVDEVAIYTNVLTYNQITNHYYAATNGAGAYAATILGDNPCMYWRMDAPVYTNPPVTSYPPAANYGSSGAGITNFNTLGTSAVYQPGAVPGVAGPAYAGFGGMTNACAFNGLVGAVDAGYNNLLNPTGFTNNFTFVAWFEGNPMDNNSRYNSLASHSNNSWKIQFRNGTTYGYKGASTQPSIAPATFNVNDGNWHMIVVESTYTNGISTNVTVSLDRGVISATAANPASIPGSTNLDAFIGCAPDYLEPTNGTYNANQQYFAGRIAHVAYFTNALTTAQLQSLYAAAVPVPAIVTQPVSATANQGSAFTNTVVVDGTPLFYQWYGNGGAISGATNASLIFNPVLPADAGANYYVVVTNNFGAVTSAVVSLTVYGLPFLAAQLPQPHTNPFTLYAGVSPVFSVTALGPQPINYQWYTNGVADGGATGSSLALTNVPVGTFTAYCTASNQFGATNSIVWTASIIPAPAAPYPAAVLAAGPIGYWRLNEGPDNGNGDQGAICHDYVAGDDGTYTNVTLAQPGYNTSTDPTETSTLFGETGISFYDSYAGQIDGVDFATPATKSAAFTIETWANGYAGSEPSGAGLVSKGYGGGGEQFDLDVYGGAYRFLVRDASGAAHGPTSTVKVDGNWHHIVGVCDEVNSNVSLYVDGSLVASNSVTPGVGILEDTLPMCIGSRSSAANTNNNLQFYGYMNDVAVYNYALSASEIAAQFRASGVAPFFTSQPPSQTNVDAGGTVALATTVLGTLPLSCQWYDANAGAALAGQTNSTLVLSNVTTSDTYYLTVANAFGSTNSAYINVNVFSGAPTLYTDVQNPFYAIDGGPATNSVQAYGTAPLAWQWQFFNGSAWVNLTDNGRITGSQTGTLTFAGTLASDAGNYQVVVTNLGGSITSSVATLVMADLPLSFFDNGLFWTANGSARMASGLLSLTDPNNGGGSGTYFFQYPQYIGAFQAAFTYQTGGNKQADGFSFCLQNDPRGTAALASGGGGLAVGNGGVITPSAELEMNIYPANGVGYAFETDGNVPAAGGFTVPGSVQINSGDPINITVNYANGQMALTLADAVADTAYATSLSVGDLTQVLGANTAYVGFTGAYGGDTSVQTITNFTFVSLATAAIQLNDRTNALISWPGQIFGYLLQQNSDLTTTNWLNVTNPDNVVNNQNQVIVPLGRTNQFYRLILSQ